MLSKLAIRKFLSKDKSWRTGFTLIELVAVILVIGVLVSIGVQSYNFLAEKSRASEAYATLKAILDAQMRYAFKHDVYAHDLADLDINIADQGKYFDFHLYNGPRPYEVDDENIAWAFNIKHEYVINITESGQASDFDEVVTGVIRK